jgi:hypothetical protein
MSTTEYSTLFSNSEKGSEYAFRSKVSKANIQVNKIFGTATANKLVHLKFHITD